MIPRFYTAWKVTRRYWAIDGEWRERSPFRSLAVVVGSVMEPNILGDRCGTLWRVKPMLAEHSLGTAVGLERIIRVFIRLGTSP